MKRPNSGGDASGTSASSAIDVDAVTDLTYDRLLNPERYDSSFRNAKQRSTEELKDRLARIVNSNRDFTSEDYETLLLLDTLDEDKPASQSSDLDQTSVEHIAMPCDDVILKDGEKIETVFKDATDCSSCAICLREFEGGQRVWQLPECKHVFHARCVSRWFEECGNNPICPICRKSHPMIDVVKHDQPGTSKENTNKCDGSRSESSKKEEEEEIILDDDDDDDDDDDVVVVEGSTPPPKKKKKHNHRHVRKHERCNPLRRPSLGRDDHPNRHASRQQRSAHCISWVNLAPGVHASYGPQTTLHAAYHALGKANAPLSHILPSQRPKK